MNSKTTWEIEQNNLSFPALQEDKMADVVVIGAGITGILSAYALAKAGQKVIILEKDSPLSGTTLYTTACLTEIIDTDVRDLIEIHGLEKTRLIYKSHEEAIGGIEKIARDEKIECEFMRCSNYIFAADEGQRKDLEERCVDLKIAGMDASICRGNELIFPNHCYIEIKNQAKFHPILFLQGVLRALTKLGVEIYSHSEVTSVTEDGETVIVKTEKAAVIGGYSLTATYQPFNNPWPVFMKKGQYISYVCEFELESGIYPEAIFEDMSNPYYYLRIDKTAGAEKDGKKDRLIIGGEDHRKELPGLEEKSFASLEEYAKKLFGDKLGRIVTRWTGLVIEPVDGLALIGRVSDRRMLATAFSGNGMTYGAITGNIAREIAKGEKSSAYAELYDPRRIPKIKELLIKGRDYTEELIKGGLKNLGK